MAAPTRARACAGRPRRSAARSGLCGARRSQRAGRAIRGDDGALRAQPGGRPRGEGAPRALPGRGGCRPGVAGRPARGLVPAVVRLRAVVDPRRRSMVAMVCVAAPADSRASDPRIGRSRRGIARHGTAGRSLLQSSDADRSGNQSRPRSALGNPGHRPRPTAGPPPALLITAHRGTGRAPTA